MNIVYEQQVTPVVTFEVALIKGKYSPFLFNSESGQVFSVKRNGTFARYNEAGVCFVSEPFNTLEKAKAQFK